MYVSRQTGIPGALGLKKQQTSVKPVILLNDELDLKAEIPQNSVEPGILLNDALDSRLKIQQIRMKPGILLNDVLD